MTARLPLKWAPCRHVVAHVMKPSQFTGTLVFLSFTFDLLLSSCPPYLLLLTFSSKCSETLDKVIEMTDDIVEQCVHNVTKVPWYSKRSIRQMKQEVL